MHTCNCIAENDMAAQDILYRSDVENYGLRKNFMRKAMIGTPWIMIYAFKTH